VVAALSAVLDLDQRSLFQKAGLDVPLEETSPTVEEAFASLAAEPRSTSVLVDPEPAAAIALVEEPDLHIELDVESQTEFDGETKAPSEVSDEPLESAEGQKPAEEPYPVWEPEFPEETFIRSTRVASTSVTPMPAPAFLDPPDPFVLAPATPPLVEPSYMEDTGQRQLYRVRNLATVVLLVGLGIVLLWAFSSTLDALGSWWDDFIGTLKL
jgi:hypothetical protein